jgi:hypothetical protein
MAANGPKDPYSYLFQSRGLSVPQGGQPTPLPLTDAIRQAYQNNGVNLQQAQSQLTGAFQNPFISQGQGYLGQLGSSLQPQALNQGSGNPLTDFLSAHPGLQSFITSHPGFNDFISSHPMFSGGQAQPAADSANPLQGQPAQPAPQQASVPPPAPVGSATAQPAVAQAQPNAASANPMAQPAAAAQPSTDSSQPVGSPAILTGGQPAGPQAPVNPNMLDPYTKAFTGGTGIPGAPSAQQISQAGGDVTSPENAVGSAMQGYQDYVQNVAGGSFQDIMGLAKNLFPTAGAPVASGFK